MAFSTEQFPAAPECSVHTFSTPLNVNPSGEYFSRGFRRSMLNGAKHEWQYIMLQKPESEYKRKT